jgi:hypothetical protein
MISYRLRSASANLESKRTRIDGWAARLPMGCDCCVMLS